MRDLEQYQIDYGALPFESVQAFYRKKKIVETLGRLKARRILEVGCGTEPLFTVYGNFDHMYVVEPGERFCNRATELAGGRPEISVIRGTLEHVITQFSGVTLDCIVISSLLHELENPDGLLAAARAICGEGTTVHVNVPNATSLHRILAVEMGLLATPFSRTHTQEKMQQHGTFDMERLKELLSRNGFDVLETGSFFLKPFSHAQMAQLVQSGFLSVQLLDAFYSISEKLGALGSELYINARRGGAT